MKIAVCCLVLVVCLGAMTVEAVGRRAMTESGEESFRVSQAVDVAKVKDSAVLEVFVLHAPLMKKKAGGALGAMNLFHGGLGYCETGASSNCGGFEYNAKNGVVAALLPVAKDNSLVVNNGSFVWANEGQVVLLTDVSINGSYWEQKVVLGTMKGSDFNKVVPKFVADYAKENKRYKLFEVVDSKKQALKLKGDKLKSSTCVDFVQAVINKLISKKALCPSKEALADSKFKRDFVRLYGESINVVDPSKPAEKAMADKAYQSAAAQIDQIHKTIAGARNSNTTASLPANQVKQAFDIKSVKDMLTKLAATPDKVFPVFVDSKTTAMVKLSAPFIDNEYAVYKTDKCSGTGASPTALQPGA